MLYVKNKKTEICQSGCEYITAFLAVYPSTPYQLITSLASDIYQIINKAEESVRTYKPGLAKLLAARNIEAAADTDDNYVYFGIARYVQKKLGVYPTFPRIWSGTKTKKEIQAPENRKPGASSRANQALELDDSNLNRGLEEAISNTPYTHSICPAWYKPANWPWGGVAVELDFGTLACSQPNINDVVCQITSTSAQSGDCGKAFAEL
jgi:hypothetical protein